ncbi:MAG: CheR family methyltransferase [Thiogranum sp.]|nr:CheR family methyltransferase [Thiogranum sp.]
MRARVYASGITCAASEIAMLARDCVEFLQWALPRLGLRWTGFRRVRGQVCKRIARRLDTLGLTTIHAYRQRLAAEPQEWLQLDALCRITISRFYRDRGVFETLGEGILPALADHACARGDTVLRAWSIGCASGEEPYSVSLIWQLRPPPAAASLRLQILATDVDPAVIGRARTGVYPHSSTRDLPAPWRVQAFDIAAGRLMLRPELRRPVHFCCHDIRARPPRLRFDLILCRNLVFTYYEHDLQLQLAKVLGSCLRHPGALVLGSHESLPQAVTGFERWQHGLPIFIRNHVTG